MVLDDSGPRLSSRASTMSNPTTASSAAGTSNPPAAAAAAAADDSASTITVNTKAPSANFPPPKTDKPRPHVCATCQRSFARLEHLKRHERSHTKEKPFECPECARCFARRDLLLRHQQKLHQTSTPSSRPRNRRESASGVTPAQSRRKNSVAGVNAAGSGAAAAPMRPRANTISHVDGAAMQMLASANASVARGMAHSRHPSLVGLPVHNLDHVFGGMSAVLGQRGLQHALPKLETSQIGSSDFDASGLRTAPPMAVFNPEFDFEGLFFGPGSTINPNALHYNDSPQSMAVDQTSPFGQGLNDVATTQHFDDWVTGFEHQMSFNTNEHVIDGSSPSAISTTSQSGISDVMVDGSNHPAPAGTSTMWQPSVMGPPQMPNPFAMDLNGSVFPDLLSGAPLSPQPASQKINDPYFSAPPTSLSSLSTSVVSGINSQPLNPPLGFNAAQEIPSSLNGGNHAASPVTTITDATRTAIVTILSHCLPFGSRKNPSLSSLGSPLSPQIQPGGNSSSNPATDVPSTQDLQRYVRAYLTCFHPHLPFLHLPTLSFDVSPDSKGRSNGAGGNGCLLLSMAAFGAAYEMEHAQSKDLFEMAKKIVFFYLDERRKSDVRRADTRLSTISTDSKAQQNQAQSSTPLWLVQAMLLNVIYGHTCSDKVTSDIASTHCASLVSLAQSSGLISQGKGNVPTEQDVHMTDTGDWTRISEQDEQREWLQWKSMEEHKRTVYVIFILSSMAVASFNHTPALTNSEITLDLPCDEEFFAAESSAAFASRGGVEAANHNRLRFFDSLGDLLRANERQHSMGNSQPQFGSPMNTADTPLTDLKPSTFGCLVLIYALHNYIWETRQRHQNRAWTNMETEKMHTHIEPALKAWQFAWSSNPQHSIERPNPFGLGPMSADAIPLLDLAYVKLFVDFGPAKAKIWQRDWDGMIEELSRGFETQDEARSPTCSSESGTEPSSNSVINPGFMDSPATQSSLNSMHADKPFGTGQDVNGTGRSIPRRERYLRTASFYAVDSLSMSDRLGVTFAYTRNLAIRPAHCKNLSTMSFGKTVKLNSGHTIPRVGYGTWQAGPGEVGNGVYEALKTGYRHLDLAKIYGNQKEVGEGIKRAYAEIPGLKREDIFITSKLWNNKHRPEDVEKALDDTLAELQLDYLDLYLIHWPVAFKPGEEQFPKLANGEVDIDRGVTISQTWKAMTELPKTKARSVGVSNFSIEHLEGVIAATGVVPAVNQIERHPRLPNAPLIEYCAKKNIIITAYSAFGNNSWSIPLLVNTPEVKAIADRLGAAQGKTITAAQVIIAWSVLGNHTVIPKSVTPSRIHKNFQEVELDEQAIQDLKKFGETPQRFNIPTTYDPKWNINVFNDEKDKNASLQVLIK